MPKRKRSRDLGDPLRNSRTYVSIPLWVLMAILWGVFPAAVSDNSPVTGPPAAAGLPQLVDQEELAE